MENSTDRATTVSRLDKLFQKSLEDLKRRSENKKNEACLTTGFHTIDSYIGGWIPGELVILGARPGMGKTTLLMNMMMEISKKSLLKVGFISLETSRDFLIERFISMESDLSSISLRKARLSDADWEKLGDMYLGVENKNIFIAENPFADVRYIEDLIREFVEVHGVKMIFIDYLQLIEAVKGFRNRDQEVTSIIRSLKKLAKELNVALIIASQLNRSVEIRSGNKRPYLSDLRDSGSIEEDADKVIFIFRPELYGMDTDELGNSLKGYVELIVEKNRSGPCGGIVINFNKHTGRFYEEVTDPSAFGDISLDDLPDDIPPF